MAKVIAEHLSRQPVFIPIRIMAKILIYTLVFPPDQVSNAHVLANLVRGLKELGHEIKILTTTPHYQTLPEASAKQPLIPYLGRWIFKSDFEGVPCYHIKVPKTKGGLLKRIWTALLFHLRSLWFGRRKELDCDVVIAFTPPPTIGIIASKIAKRHGACSIFSVCDLPFLLFDVASRRLKLLGKILRCFERSGFNGCDAVVGVTPSSIDYICSQTTRNRVLNVIPDSVDLDIYRPHGKINDYSRKKNWEDKFVISYLGNIGKAQDFSPLPDVVTACSDLDVKFICAGSGLKYEELARTAKELGNPKWEVWGHQLIDTTVMINASSDLCLVLLDRKITKGSFPSKLYTIMASARPVLYYGPCETDVGRLIRENDLGWTIETGDIDGFVRAIREAYSDPERRERMGQNGLKLVGERYSTQVVAKQYHELIEKLLSMKKTSR